MLLYFNEIGVSHGYKFAPITVKTKNNLIIFVLLPYSTKIIFQHFHEVDGSLNIYTKKQQL